MSGQILMACRAVSATKFQVAAAGPRADVFFPTGKGANATHSANGVAWYFDDAFSWGFTTDGNAVDRISCDFTDGADRVCWSTKPATAGYRCGDKKDLDIDAGARRGSPPLGPRVERATASRRAAARVARLRHAFRRPRVERTEDQLPRLRR